MEKLLPILLLIGLFGSCVPTKHYGKKGGGGGSGWGPPPSHGNEGGGGWGPPQNHGNEGGGGWGPPPSHGNEGGGGWGSPPNQGGHQSSYPQQQHPPSQHQSGGHAETINLPIRLPEIKLPKLINIIIRLVQSESGESNGIPESPRPHGHQQQSGHNLSPYARHG